MSSKHPGHPSRRFPFVVPFRDELSLIGWVPSSLLRWNMPPQPLWMESVYAPSFHLPGPRALHPRGPIWGTHPFPDSFCPCVLHLEIPWVLWVGSVVGIEQQDGTTPHTAKAAGERHKRGGGEGTGNIVLITHPAQRPGGSCRHHHRRGHHQDQHVPSGVPLITHEQGLGESFNRWRR